MSRWRPPTTPSTALITREGLERLRAELNDLWNMKRPEVVRALSAAAAEGDRSENAEYIYRKKQLGEIDRRVRFLSKRLEILKVPDLAQAPANKIFFGAYFELENEDGDTRLYRIVGPDETDAKLSWISIDSPLARAALNKSIDHEFEVELPTGLTSFVVISIRYN
ncbi:MAG TPA: transcription elongation factor GreB [Arenimonas sp.]|nr:transcription elongation factor GreB [Arenimonas sp.]